MREKERIKEENREGRKKENKEISSNYLSTMAVEVNLAQLWPKQKSLEDLES